MRKEKLFAAISLEVMSYVITHREIPLQKEITFTSKDPCKLADTKAYDGITDLIYIRP